ncbi:MAG: diacylglyceryl transferase [Flavobacteriaceae bacterium]|nr:diacylglyceryl transferase [Flavobacteriaceae bacterium]
MGYFKKLKEKWDVKSNFQFLIIFIVFGITGSSSVVVAKPIMEVLGILPVYFEDIFLGNVVYWMLRILVIFPVYQILLLLFGILFFQFKFFWNFEKKILSRMGFKRFFTDY